MRLSRVLLLAGAVPLATFISASAADSDRIRGLPDNAVVIEEQRLSDSVRAGRTLVLWMEHPERHRRHQESGADYNVLEEPGDTYTCPEETRGSFYRGPTRVSLVDDYSGSIINTVRITAELVRGERDSFDIPYWIQPKHYRVLPPLRVGEGAPKIIDLRDLNGDGNALEFALFNAQACTVVDTQLVGYSAVRDQVIRYPIQRSGNSWWHSPRTVYWLENWLTREPTSPGYWHCRDFWNSGVTCTYDVRYNPAGEEFVATVHCAESQAPIAPDSALPAL